MKVSGQDRVADLYPEVVAAPEGDVTVLWTTQRQVVRSRTRQAGGSWGPVLRVGEGDLQDAAVDDSGRVTAVWRHWIGGRTVAVASTRADGGAWSTPRRLSRIPQSLGTYTQAHDVQVAVSPTGAAVAAWTYGSQDGGPWDRAQASFRPAGGVWGPPVRLADPLSEVRDVAITASGQPMVLIESKRLFTVRRTAEGWRRVGGSFATRAGDSESLEIGPGGHHVLVMEVAGRRREGHPRPYVVVGSRLRDGRWQPPVRLSRQVRARGPALGVDQQGVATVAWRTAQGRIQVARWIPGQRPSRPVLLSAENAWFPSVAVAPGGAAVAAWTRPGTPGRDQVIAASRPAGGPWRPPWILSLDREVVWPVGEGLDVWPDGRGAAAWADTSPRGRVWVSWKR